MYIWKEAIHGNRHSDQDADNRAWHTKRAFEESGFFAKPTQFAVFSFNVFPSKTMPHVENPIAVYKSVLSNASE